MVECIICVIMLESRQKISNHRQIKHQIQTIARCRFFPECIDEDECFFKHDTEPEKRNSQSHFSVKMEKTVLISHVKSANQTTTGRSQFCVGFKQTVTGLVAVSNTR